MCIKRFVFTFVCVCVCVCVCVGIYGKIRFTDLNRFRWKDVELCVRERTSIHDAPRVFYAITSTNLKTFDSSWFATAAFRTEVLD